VHRDADGQGVLEHRAAGHARPAGGLSDSRFGSIASGLADRLEPDREGISSGCRHRNFWPSPLRPARGRSRVSPEERDFVRRSPGSVWRAKRNTPSSTRRARSWQSLEGWRAPGTQRRGWLRQVGQRDEDAPLSHHYAEAARPDYADLAWPGGRELGEGGRLATASRRPRSHAMPSTGARSVHARAGAERSTRSSSGAIGRPACSTSTESPSESTATRRRSLLRSGGRRRRLRPAIQTAQRPGCEGRPGDGVGRLIDQALALHRKRAPRLKALAAIYLHAEPRTRPAGFRHRRAPG
jgi:hypothetical protein